MSTQHPFVATLTALFNDPSAAGISISTDYRSPMPTIAPPAGTLRAGGAGGKPVEDVHGEFDLPDGRQAVVIDSVGSQASRMEAAAEDLTDQVGLPLVRFIDDQGELLTTSARLSHRHADAIWRASITELTAAGIPFDQIQAATVDSAQPLLDWFPTALLMGWWHSQVLVTDPKKAKTTAKDRTDALHGDTQAAQTLAGYAQQGPQMRSARVMTAEIIATGVARRRRMPAKVDSLLGPLAKTTAKGPSSLGLGSLPPVHESRAVIDVTYDDIRGSWWLSLAGLREFAGLQEPETARVLLSCLALLLHDHAQRATRLRSGTELVTATRTVEVWRHGRAPEGLEVPDHDTLVEIVRTLGVQAGWHGPQDVTIPKGSVLDRIMHIAAAEADTAAADA